MMNEKDKRKSEILAILFGTVFSLLLIYCLVRFICQIKFEYEKEKINRRNRRLLLTNSMNIN